MWFLRSHINTTIRKVGNLWCNWCHKTTTKQIWDIIHTEILWTTLEISLNGLVITVVSFPKIRELEKQVCRSNLLLSECTRQWIHWLTNRWSLASAADLLELFSWQQYQLETIIRAKKRNQTIKWCVFCCVGQTSFNIQAFEKIPLVLALMTLWLSVEASKSDHSVSSTDSFASSTN